jgi:FtsH-binding integral membrane protein
MNPSYSHGGFAADTADRTRTLFGQVMWYVAATVGVFALGSYLGRDLGHGVAIIAYIAALACLIGLNFAVRRSAGLTTGLLLAFGVLLGLARSPTLTFYAAVDPRVLWPAGPATALFIAGFGAAGYAARRDLSGVGRVCFWALLPEQLR